MPDHESQAQVSAVEIARLAGVGRAAVSNWRRRHADFPRPVGGTENSPAFSLAEIEGWLRAQGKIAEVPLRERVRQRIERLRDPAASPAAPLVPALAQLLLLHRAPARWQDLAARDDLDLAVALPAALATLAADVLGTDGARLLQLPTLYGSTQLELARLLAELADRTGPVAVAVELISSHTDTANRPGAAVPPQVAELLADLAAGAATGEATEVLDPACGNGALLLEAARRGASTLHGQDADPALAAVTLLRLALAAPADRPGPLPFDLATGDALRADARPGLAADAVLSRPPYNERNWGANELGYDPRWEYGVPPRAESELAWVQHALARVRPGGTVVLLLPGAVAARRSGRRIRAELLRRGALRGVVSLPVGVAAPYAVPLHIWLLRRPAPGESPPARLLLVDAADAGESLNGTVLAAWTAFQAAGDAAAPEAPGRYRAVPVIDLLDDETDLTPGRHLPQRPADTYGELATVQQQLEALLGELAPLERSLPGYRPADGAVPHRAASTVGELIRAGALELLAEGEPLRPGDVLLPGPGTGGFAGVHEGEPGESVGLADLAGYVQVLRPDQAVLDPWFLAGFISVAALSTAVRSERSGSLTSTASRRDIRRTRVPRLSPAQQRRYAGPFRQLASFDRTVRQIAELGGQLAQGIASGLVDGGLTPEE
ncbi:SAM-dependent methyltransferase/predicted DNA-binding transcriptional regulator AlpA [Streptacidiphilus sp. MAP12-16]|uniref:N-6 DNA methylase n=1 Tax=Streptacidiphilus sp. MAP12-16 TaxID=3156300 RepID=UPI003516A3BC